MNLNIYTPTELLNLINEKQKKHEIIKSKMLSILDQIGEKEIEFNSLKDELELEEKKYIKLINELQSRK